MDVSGKSGRILVCGDSNQSVDNICAKFKQVLLFYGLQKKHKFVRWMSSHHFRKRTFDTNIKAHIIPKYGKKSKKQKANKRKDFNEDLAKNMDDARVVFCTLSKAASLDKFMNVNSSSGDMKKYNKDDFIYSLIDEASQTLETTSLAAVRSTSQKLVLIGDQKQLGPVIQNNQVREAGIKSLFERMIQNNAPLCFLDTQYRMHPTLGNLISSNFYGNQLKNGVMK